MTQEERQQRIHGVLLLLLAIKTATNAIMKLVLAMAADAPIDSQQLFSDYLDTMHKLRDDLERAEPVFYRALAREDKPAHKQGITEHELDRWLMRARVRRSEKKRLERKS